MYIALNFKFSINRKKVKETENKRVQTQNNRNEKRNETKKQDYSKPKIMNKI